MLNNFPETFPIFERKREREGREREKKENLLIFFCSIRLCIIIIIINNIINYIKPSRVGRTVGWLVMQL